MPKDSLVGRGSCGYQGPGYYHLQVLTVYRTAFTLSPASIFLGTSEAAQTGAGNP